MTNAKKHHVHAEVIKAWADGAVIEYRHDSTHEWRTTVCPNWNHYTEYRIKPQPVVKYHGIMQGTDDYKCMNHNTGYHSELSHVRAYYDNWKVIAIVKTTFVDGVPTEIEIVK